MTDPELHNYIEKNEEFHEEELAERAEMKKEFGEMKEMLKDVHKALYGNKDTGEQGIVENMKIVTDLKGFWRVVGFGGGAILLVTGSIAGIISLINVSKHN